MKKKPLALFLAAAAALSLLAGCGDQSAGTKTPATTPTPAPAESQAPVRTEEMWLESGGKKIYGAMYLPGEEKDSYPTVILSHGFNSSSELNKGYAESFAKNGFAAYIFDFCGGSPGVKSEGKTTEMSVLTEYQNLSDVMDQIKALDYVDGDNLFLFGLSQGGFVSAYTAAQRPDDVKGLVLFYPAFVLQEEYFEKYDSVDAIPDEDFESMGVPLGAIYAKDARSFDIYDEIGKYKGDVLICHGDKDTLVDASYSERAADVYDNAELKIIQYGEHGFQGKLAREATGYTVDFLKAHVN